MKLFALSCVFLTECSAVMVTNGEVLHVYDTDPSTSDSFMGGTVATYSCADGYELVGEERRTCLVDGTWRGDEPQCVGVWI